MFFCAFRHRRARSDGLTLKRRQGWPPHAEHGTTVFPSFLWMLLQQDPDEVPERLNYKGTLVPIYLVLIK